MLRTVPNVKNRKIKLLKEIDKTGPILKAAKYIGISYKRARYYVNEINNISKEIVIITDSANNMNLKAVDEISLIFKTVHVILGV